MNKILSVGGGHDEAKWVGVTVMAVMKLKKKKKKEERRGRSRDRVQVKIQNDGYFLFLFLFFFYYFSSFFLLLSSFLSGSPRFEFKCGRGR